MHEHAVGGIVFNPESCKGCGLCVETCRSRARRISSEVNSRGVHPVQHKAEICQACGTCYYFCPELGARTRTPVSAGSLKATPIVSVFIDVLYVR